MEEASSSDILEGEIVGITFALATNHEICTASISEAPINQQSQLSNAFLGLPLEFGKCESCGATEPDKCEGHFGYIQLPVPIYHPAYVNELKQMLSLLCLKCLKLKKMKSTSGGIAERLVGACCQESSILIRQKKSDGASYLELKLPARSRLEAGIWNFLDRYGYRYGHETTRPLLAREVKEILRKIPEETRKKLKAKGHFPQEGYIIEYLPVPPNCLSVPDVSDGYRSMSQDPSRIQLKNVLKKVIAIASSRSGETNFESHKAEANDMFNAVDHYLLVRGTAKPERNIDKKFGVSNKIAESSSAKAWAEKMKKLFIRKGSGFSSRCIITGDAYRKVNEIGLPMEIAHRITFEERVSVHNINFLQELVDQKMCLSYTSGSSTYSLRDGSKGHTVLKPGQIVHRRVMDGDVVFINRPPTTHKHSLQALRVYVHEDNTVKINLLMCGPFNADFDGDCVHLFFPQSLTAKAEVMELFSVEKQLLSSHSGQLILQLGCDSLLSLRVMLERVFLDKAAAQQLAMYGSLSLPPPALRKSSKSGPAWTAFQVLQLAFPEHLSCKGDRFMVNGSELLTFDFGAEAMASIINDIATKILLEKGPKEALGFFDSLQPLLMEHLFGEGFSLSLEDFSMSRADMNVIHNLIIREISPMVSRLRLSYKDELQLENSIQKVKEVAVNFMLKSDAMRKLIDIKSNLAINRLVQQVAFLGLQLSDKNKYYTKTLVEDMAQFCKRKYGRISSSGDFGIVKGCFFHGLDPYEEMAHSIASREVMVRSSKGLSDPGTLFKGLMAVLRDVAITNDGTVRNTCSNSVVQFNYEVNSEQGHQRLFEAGEPVGVLAATAISTPAYKAVLDSSASSTSSWELMKEVLLCKVKFQNMKNDRRIILYLNECRCGKRFCQENAAYTVRNKLKRVSLKDTAVEFLVEYRKEKTISEIFGNDSCLHGHIHLNKTLLEDWNITMKDIVQKCEDVVNSLGAQKKKKKADDFKRTNLTFRECCSFGDPCASEEDSGMPCLMFSSYNAADPDLERTLDVICNTIYPVLLETLIKGDPRISSANIIWSSSEMTTWIRNRHASRRGEWVLDVTVEKSAVKQSGDAWRVVIDSCLSVLHLIDTKRSIPYSIKQVQELLGLSCAFEQTVQRLTSSVGMVTRGVLKEHLILVANNMTCSGDLLGFNNAGYKALIRSLNIKAPFTEATKATPKKCFEKAAQSCLTDSLSTVVGSCSWGKRVDVGTGSQFELLWNEKESGLDNEGETDVYSFLQMVRSTNGTDAYVSSPGFDVAEEEMADWAESPERNGEAKFEDSAEFEALLDEGKPSESKWGNGGSDNGGSEWGVPKEDGSSSAWNTKSNAPEASKSDEWGAWGSKSKDDDAANVEPSWGSKPAQTNEPASDGWGAKKDSETESASASAWGSSDRKNPEAAASGSWGKKDSGTESGAGVWGARNKTTEPVGSTWGSSDKTESSAGAWGSQNKKAEPVGAAWGSSNKPESSAGVWGSQNKETEPVGTAWGSSNKPESSAGVWGSQNKETEPVGAAWGSSDKAESSSGVWGSQNKKTEPVGTAWGSSDKTESSDGVWGSQNKKTEPVGAAWGSSDKTNSETESGAGVWGSRNKKSTETESSGATWGSRDRTKSDSQSGGAPWSSWGKKSTETNSGPAAWGSQETEPGASTWGKKSTKTNSGPAAWGSQETEPGASTWGKKSTETNSGPAAWGSQETEQDATSWGIKKNSDADTAPATWGQPSSDKDDATVDDGNPWVSLKETKTGDNEEKERTQWGNPAKRFPSDGSSSWSHGGGGNGGNGEWKGNRNRPPRPPGSENNLAPMFTATRQRLDMFTSEEQELLSDIEPILKTLRKIMHQSSYPEGEPISDEDKTWVLEKILNYHPEKDAKIGSGIDFITVDKHTTFSDSRCFFVVSTDGAKQDFSYRKCLNNYLIQKYPDLAEEFIGKYFKLRSNENRNRNNNQDAAATPNGEEGSQTQTNGGAEDTQTQTQTQPIGNGSEDDQTEARPEAESSGGKTGNGGEVESQAMV